MCGHNAVILFLSDLEVDDNGSHKDTDTLAEIAQHVDEGSFDVEVVGTTLFLRGFWNRTAVR